MRPLAPALALSSLGLLVLSTFSYAETEKDVPAPVQSPPIEVSAFRLPTLLTETTQGVNIVTSADIAARNPAHIAEVLQAVPGLQVDRIGGAGGFSSIYVRGSDPEHVLVLIDGIRMNNPLLSRGGGYDLSAIDPASVERIEIIRGTGSALYGSDAIGGVVNIVTKRPTQDALRFDVGGAAGNQRYLAGHGRVQGSANGIGYSAGVAKMQDGRNSSGGEIDLLTLDGSVTAEPLPGLSVRAFARHNDRESTAFPDASGGIRLAVLRTLEERDASEDTLGANARYRITDQMSVGLQVTYYDREEDTVSPGVDGNIPAGRTRTDLTRNNLVLTGHSTLPMNSDLTVGYEYQREEGDNRGSLAFLGSTDFSRSRDTNALFAAWKAKPMEALVVNAELRYDKVEGFDAEFSPGLGARYTLPFGTSIKGRYSEGFRAPSFIALASPLVGNPNLTAETSRSLEAGAEHAITDQILAGLTVFRTKTRNLVDFDSTFGTGPLGIGQNVNRKSVDGKGFEAQVDARLFDQIKLGGSYTYTSLDVAGTTSKLRNRPKHRAALTALYSIDTVSQVAWNTIYVGSTNDFSYPTGETRVGSYTRTDVSYSTQWQNLKASFAIDNLFDQDYEEFVGFRAPGVRYRLSLSATFLRDQLSVWGTSQMADGPVSCRNWPT